MVRSFPDNGVLIDAARGVLPFDQIAFNYLDDSRHIFLTSPFVQLEVLPKAAYHQRGDELAFYETFFHHQPLEWCRDSEQITRLADQEGCQYGLGALDALHVAAAYLLGADELVTTERPTKPIYRTSLIQVVYLYRDLPQPIVTSASH